jgi:hypothetical protein
VPCAILTLKAHSFVCFPVSSHDPLGKNPPYIACLGHTLFSSCLSVKQVLSLGADGPRKRPL